MITYGDVRFKIGRMLVKGNIRENRDQLEIAFGFNNELKDEIKSMDGAKWHGFDKPSPKKIWSIKNNERNQFQLAYLLGKNPYEPYDSELIPLTKADFKRPVYNHQIEGTRFLLTRRQCVLAWEMGSGKTLVSIEAMERSKVQEWIWVGPRSALAQVRIDFIKWGSHVWPQFITYEGLVKLIENWPSGRPAPKGIVFDEASRVKNHTAQRSQAAKFLADSMRKEYGRDAHIYLLSGSPAPKDPTNWWHIAEIACPGFLKEGTVEKLRRRLALMKMMEMSDGFAFPKLVTWWDDEKKCAICGQYENDDIHNQESSLMGVEGDYHQFKPSTNEINILYQRLRGLVDVKFKKDVLDLPEKIFRRIVCEPNKETLYAAELIKASAPSAIKALTLMRELSDGFQYQEIQSGVEQCPVCKGTKKQDEYFDEERPDELLDAESISIGKRVIYNEEGIRVGVEEKPLKLGIRKKDCDKCHASGSIPTYSRDIVEVECPKDQAVLDLLDQYNDEGRVVFWGGFTGSIDRLVKMILKEKWGVIRVDGRGWWASFGAGMTQEQMLYIFQKDKDTYPKIAWVGQPGAGGMGVDLTSSSMEAYYSNTFNAEDRIQSLDRIHRPGADHNRGCTIWDIIHLPSDIYVIDNLNKKIDLQSMSMGVMKDQLDKIDLEKERLL